MAPASDRSGRRLPGRLAETIVADPDRLVSRAAHAFSRNQDDSDPTLSATNFGVSAVSEVAGCAP